MIQKTTFRKLHSREHEELNKISVIGSPTSKLVKPW